MVPDLWWPNINVMSGHVLHNLVKIMTSLFFVRSSGISGVTAESRSLDRNVNGSKVSFYWLTAIVRPSHRYSDHSCVHVPDDDRWADQPVRCAAGRSHPGCDGPVLHRPPQHTDHQGTFHGARCHAGSRGDDDRPTAGTASILATVTTARRSEHRVALKFPVQFVFPSNLVGVCT